MSIRKPEPQTAVKMIRAAFITAGGTGKLSTKDAYNLLAELEGYKNWAHAKPFLTKGAQAAADEPVMGKTRAEISGWKRFVIFMKLDDYGDEVLFLMPPGATLASRALPRGGLPYDEEGSVPMPELEDANGLYAGRKLDECFVVTEVFSMVPRPERYGLPHYANELGVQRWIEEDLGWNFLAIEGSAGARHCNVDVGFIESFDDGGGCYWMEVAVEPSLAAILEKEYAEAFAEQERDSDIEV